MGMDPTRIEPQRYELPVCPSTALSLQQVRRIGAGPWSGQYPGAVGRAGTPEKGKMEDGGQDGGWEGST